MLEQIAQYVIEELELLAKFQQEQATAELVEVVTAVAEKANWAIEGKRVTLSANVRARIADQVEDGEQPGDLAYKAYKAGWPAEVCSVVARYGRAVACNVAKGRSVNKFWGAAAATA